MRKVLTRQLLSRGKPNRAANTETASKPSRSVVFSHQDIHPGVIIRKAEADPASLTPDAVMQLQRTIGNRAVGRLIQGLRDGTIQKKPDPSTPAVLQLKEFVIQRGANDPMDIAYINTHTRTAVQTKLGAFFESQKNAYLGTLNGVSATARGILSNGFNSALDATEDNFLDTVIAPLLVTMRENCNGVWEKFFNSYFNEEWKNFLRTVAYTGWRTGTLRPIATAATGKRDKVVASVRTFNEQLATAIGREEEYITGLEGGIIDEHQNSDNKSLKLAIRYLKQETNSFKRLVQQIKGAYETRMGNTAFLYTHSDEEIEQQFRTTKDTITGEITDGKRGVTAANTQAESFTLEDNQIENDLYDIINRNARGARIHFTPRLLELKRITRNADYTSIRYLSEMVRDEDNPALDALANLNNTEQSRLFGILRFNRYFREQFFAAARSGADLGNLIAEAAHIQSVIDITELSAGTRGRLPHHLSEHGPQVPDEAAKTLASGKLSGVNSRWINFNTMNLCLRHALGTLHGSRFGADPYGAISSNLGGKTIRRFLSDNNHYRLNQLTQYLDENVNQTISKATVGGAVAGLTSLGPTFDQDGQTAAVNTRFTVGMKLNKAHGQWQYSIITGYPRV